MTTMLEKAARALFERGRSSHDAESWEAAGEEMQQWLIGHARAVLGAIREPESSVLDVVEYDSHGWAARNFTAMIDHILAEPNQD